MKKYLVCWVRMSCEDFNTYFDDMKREFDHLADALEWAKRNDGHVYELVC
jgi:hypothetical protein